MSECKDREIARLLHAYELGLLSDKDRARVELHIYQCDSCIQELLEMEKASGLMRQDSDVRQAIEETVRETSEQPVHQVSKRTLWRVVAPLAAVAAIVLLLVLKDWQVDIRPSEEAVAGEARLAVLPFENLSLPSDSSRMGEIVANLLATELSQYASLQVVSSQYIYDLKRKIQASQRPSYRDVSEAVARQAGARWRLDGTVSQTANEVIMTAQVVEVTTGVVKASTRISAPLDRSLFAAVDSLSVRLRTALLRPSAIATAPIRSVEEMTTSSPEAYQEYIRGLDAYRKFFTQESEAHFRRAVELDSTFAMPYYYLSLKTTTPDWQVNLQRAERYLDRASERDRYFIRSRTAQAAGDWRTTLELLNQFVDKYKDEKEPLYQLATFEYQYAIYDRAEKHLLMSAALDSSNTEVWNLLAYTYDMLGDFESAMRSVDRYISLAPDQPNPLDSRAEIYARNNRLDQAIESYRQALRLKPDYYASLSLLGVMYTFKEDYGRAESCFTAVSKSPLVADRRAAAMYYAYVAAYQGHFREAIHRIDTAISTDSAAGYTRNLVRRLHWKATLYEASGDIDEAIRAMEWGIALDSNPDRSDDNRRTAYYIHLLAAAGKTKEALEQAARLRNDVESGQFYKTPYYVAMASIELACRKPDSAVTYLSLDIDHLKFFYDYAVLGRAYFEAHMLAESVTALQKANTRYLPVRLFWGIESVKLHYYLGRAYEKSNWPSQAADEYRRFLSIWKSADPGIKEIEDAKARLKTLEHS